MPTTAITAQAAPSAWATAAQAITWTAADVANGNHIAIPSNGSTKWILLARNVHAVTTYTVTVTSTADSLFGRTGDCGPTNITAGNQVFIQLTSDGWKNASDQIAFSANNASVQFAFFTI